MSVPWSPWIGDAIAALALLVAVVSVWLSRRTSKRQEEADEKIRAFTVGQIEAAERVAGEARIRLVCYTSKHLTVENVGGADARDVTVVCMCPSGRSAFADDRLLPFTVIEAGRSRRVLLSLASGCYFPLDATVTWTDPTGPKEKRVTLQLEG